jgi:AbrB family looped-hinge helix DNA binding protein
MHRVKVSPKGQIAIPKALLESLHIGPGSELTVVAAGDGIHLRMSTPAVAPTTVESGLGLLAGRAGRHIPESEIRQRIGQRIRSRDEESKDPQ